jgi:hypothetical protein
MTTTVYIDLDEDVKPGLEVEYLQGLIPSMYRVHKVGDQLAIDVPESRDAVDEITEVLSDNLVNAYVYPGEPKLDGEHRSIDRPNHNYDDYNG